MFVFIVGFIGLLWLYYWIQNRSYSKMIDHFPGPKKLPLFGNALEWTNKTDVLFSTVRKYADKYKTTYRLWAGPIPSVNIITAEDVEIVLSSSAEFKKSFVYNFIHPWLGTGLLTSHGQKWHQRRKILTPAFNLNILKRFVVIFNEHSEKLINQLKEECHKPKTNIVSLMSQCTLNTICETAMGINMNSNEITVKKYFQAIYGMTKIFIQRTINPLYYNYFVFNCCPIGWKQRDYVKILHSFTERVIKDRQENFQENDVNDLEQEDDGMDRKKRLAMLDLLIHAKNNRSVIDDTGIREEVDTFMFAGHDTAALALSSSLMTLANHEDVQDKIFDELRDIFGTSNRQPTYNDLQNMKYLEMCLKECLRLYPSVPLIAREYEEDLVLSTGVVPRGCMIGIHIYDLHRNPNIYPEPEKFDPDRFLPEQVQGRHPFSYVPFSAGSRNCIGQKFAMLEMKTIVSSILRNYKLEAVTTPKDLRLIADIVLRNKDEVYVKFNERTNKI